MRCVKTCLKIPPPVCPRAMSPEVISGLTLFFGFLTAVFLAVNTIRHWDRDDYDRDRHAQDDARRAKERQEDREFELKKDRLRKVEDARKDLLDVFNGRYSVRQMADLCSRHLRDMPLVDLMPLVSEAIDASTISSGEKSTLKASMEAQLDRKNLQTSTSTQR
jgi:hypothetical protein